jgi:hypothetical protein
MLYTEALFLNLSRGGLAVETDNGPSINVLLKRRTKDATMTTPQVFNGQLIKIVH